MLAGGTKQITMKDLLQDYEQLPPEVRKLLEACDDCMSYDECRELQAKLAELGYTIDFDLDGSCFDLKKAVSPNT